MVIQFLLFVLFRCPDNAEASKSEPQVYIFIPVHAYSQSKVLPFTLSGIETQDYPRNRINVHISFDLYRSVLENTHDESLLRFRRNRLTYEAIKNWIDSNKESYNDIHLDIKYLEDDEDRINKIEKYWTYERIRELTSLRNKAMDRAKGVEADYIFYIDSDVVLVNGKTLSHLLEKRLPIVSPLIWEATGRTNLWVERRKESGDEMIEDYINIDCSHELGTNFEIASAESCLLVDLNYEGITGLRFERSEVRDLLFGGWNGVHKLAKQQNIRYYSSNEEIWGYMLPKIDRMDLDENDLNLIDIEMESLHQGLFFPESDSMKSFIERPEKDKLSVDKVYIINLERRDDRRRIMSKKLEILGIDAVFWRAVDGEELKLNPSKLEHIRIIDGTGTKTYGQVGCFLSHYQIYMDSTERDLESIIVFEDDIRFERNFIQKWYKHLKEVNIYETIHGPVDLIYLGRFAYYGPEESAGFPELILPGKSDENHGYLLKRSGIDKILASKPLENFVVIDDLFPILFDQHPDENQWSRYPDRNMKALSVEPYLVYQDRSQVQTGFHSDTTSSEVARIPSGTN